MNFKNTAQRIAVMGILRNSGRLWKRDCKGKRKKILGKVSVSGADNTMVSKNKSCFSRRRSYDTIKIDGSVVGGRTGTKISEKAKQKLRLKGRSTQSKIAQSRAKAKKVTRKSLFKNARVTGLLRNGKGKVRVAKR